MERSGWSALGSGMNTSVWALAVSGSDLYAGGQFTTAGGKSSAYIARAYLLALPELSVSGSGAEVVISWPAAGTDGFALEQACGAGRPGNLDHECRQRYRRWHQQVSNLSATTARIFRLRRP